MIAYLDACVLIRAQDAGCLDAVLNAAEASGARLAEDVFSELTTGLRKKGPRPEQNAMKSALHARELPVDSIPVFGPAGTTYAALRSGRTTSSDAGECASIALTAHHASAVFVTAETRAGWLGVSELHGRTRALPSWLHHLVNDGHLDPSEARSVMDAAKGSGVRRPSWWPHG